MATKPFSQLEKEVGIIYIAPILHSKKTGDWVALNYWGKLGRMIGELPWLRFLLVSELIVCSTCREINLVLC